MRISGNVGIVLASVVLLTDPAFAQTTPARRPPPRETQPAPRDSSWTGSQFGGFGGGSQMPVNFVEPGAFLCNPGFGPPLTTPGTPPVTPPVTPPTPPVTPPPDEGGAPLAAAAALVPQSITAPNALGCPETDFRIHSKPTSLIGGGFIGYNVQMGQIVIGVEADASVARGKASRTLQNTHPTPDAFIAPNTGYATNETFTGSIGQTMSSSLRLRAGMLVTPDVLVYITGGPTVGRVEAAFSYNACNGPLVVGAAGTTCGGGAQSWTETRVGHTYGFGTEIALAVLPAKLRLEYRHTDLGSFSKDVPLAVTSGTCTACTGNAHIDMGAKSNTFIVGLGFNFGALGALAAAAH